MNITNTITEFDIKPYGIISEIKRLYEEWLEPKYGKAYRKISEDQMQASIHYLSTFDLNSVDKLGDLFENCELSIASHNCYDNYDEKHYSKDNWYFLETDFTKEYSIWLKKIYPDLNLEIGMINFLDAVIEGHLCHLEDKQNI